MGFTAVKWGPYLIEVVYITPSLTSDSGGAHLVGMERVFGFKVLTPLGIQLIRG